MLEEIAVSVAEQIPSLVVLGLVVAIFVRYIRSRDVEIAAISKGCHEIQARAIEALDKNSEILGRVLERLR